MRSGRCSSLYQRLNSSSLSAGTSAHTIRSPVPFLAMSPSFRHGISRIGAAGPAAEHGGGGQPFERHQAPERGLIAPERVV